VKVRVLSTAPFDLEDSRFYLFPFIVTKRARIGAGYSCASAFVLLCRGFEPVNLG
jgi:hypothetical protein